MNTALNAERMTPNEQRFIRGFLAKLDTYQIAVEARHHGGCPVRGFHHKTLAATWGTYLSDKDLPKELRVGLGAVEKPLPTLVRFSSGQSFGQPDYVPDIRGFAVKILGIGGDPLPGCPPGVQDLLSVNGDNHSIRNGEIFAKLSLAAASPIDAIRTALSVLTLSEQIRLGWEFAQLALRTSEPLSSSSYFGTGPILFGGQPAKFRWLPVSPPRKRWPRLSRNGQQDQFCRDLMAQRMMFDLYIQTYVSEEATPVEDLSVRWDERRSPPYKVGSLHLKRIASPATLEKCCKDVESLAFSPWQGIAAHRPLGGLQRIRRAAYRQSADRRGARPRP